MCEQRYQYEVERQREEKEYENYLEELQESLDYGMVVDIETCGETNEHW
jgi:hypothetical protein